MIMETADTPGEPEMNRREIRLSDGRYLLFYTFDTMSPEPQADQKVDGTEEVDN